MRDKYMPWQLIYIMPLKEEHAHTTAFIYRLLQVYFT